MKYGEIYGNKLPQLIEGDIFQMTIYSSDSIQNQKRLESELATNILNSLKEAPLKKSEIASKDIRTIKNHTFISNGGSRVCRQFALILGCIFMILMNFIGRDGGI
jgi:hypothetical protein